ncbi:MAG TPA: DUF3445 domain-containing protein [Bacillales bacterium]|nr:DUF3445 domain-containing protein [Bacillales bacterium]
MTVTAVLESFPFPFEEDTFRYSNNSVPLEPPVCIEITPEYRKEIALKRRLLDTHFDRCYRSLPHTLDAQREAADLIIEQFSAFYPEHFAVVHDGQRTEVFNKLTGEKEIFGCGKLRQGEEEPLYKIGRHVQEDLILMMQRDGELYLDAGQLCFPANWSLAFDIGMAFGAIHDPVPRLSKSRLLEKIRKFIMRIEPEQPWTRKNWSLTVDRQLDTPLETVSSWGRKRQEITPENAGDRIHLRVEVQKLFRLPASHSILFSIHTHLLSVRELAGNQEWLRRFRSVVEELPDDVAAYKGLAPFRKALLEHLRLELRR